jgi:hypothetical protein
MLEEDNPLFHFIFFEYDMLAHDRIIFPHLKLFGLLARIFLCRVEKAIVLS